MSKIKLNIRPLNLRLKYPFGISRGTIDSAKNVLVTLHYGDYISFGEAAPQLFYGEDQNSVTKFLNDFVFGRTIEDYLTNIQKLKSDLHKFALENFRMSAPSARVALEMAFWDLIGKINNKALYEFFFLETDPFTPINGSYKNLPETSYTIGLDNLSVMEKKIKEAILKDFKILKIKLGYGIDDDKAILSKIREILKPYPALKVRIDVNGGWDLKTAYMMLKELQDYNIELLEQPLPKGNIDSLNELSMESKIPIFVDEDCMLLRDIESLIGKVHGINLKLMKCGSILEAINMINLAKSYNLKIMLGCMVESSCAISSAVHLSPMVDYIDLDGHLLLASDPFSGLILKDNRVIPSLDVGLGVTLID